MRLTVRRIYVFILLTMLDNVIEQIRASDCYTLDLILDEEPDQDVFYGKYSSLQ